MQMTSPKDDGMIVQEQSFVCYVSVYLWTLSCVAEWMTSAQLF